MKYSLYSFTFVIVLPFLHASAQADSASLLSQAQAANPVRYQFAVDKGAEIRSTTDNKAFTVWWQGSSTTAPVGTIVTLHGHDSYATDEFYLWQPYAEARNYAILALQWWFGANESTSDYYTPQDMYPLISALLAEKGVRPGSVMFVGFSRGSTNTYAVTAHDAVRGSHYFGMTLSNAGGAASDYPPNMDINAGLFGSQPFSGMKWAMYCGENDPNPTGSGCPAMTAARDWVTGLGATSVLFIDDAVGTHGGFMLNSANVETALKTFDGILNSATVPGCTLVASPASIFRGKSAKLTAYCYPSASSYDWTNSGFTNTAASGTVSPMTTTSYSVVGSNTTGSGAAADATIAVKPPPSLAALIDLLLGD